MMDLREAITALLTEYDLASFTEVFRDEAKADSEWMADHHSWEHPRVIRFQAIVEVLRQHGAIPKGEVAGSKTCPIVQPAYGAGALPD